MNALRVERACLEDLDALEVLETAAWPEGRQMRAARTAFETRIAIGGLWVARERAGGPLVGSLSTFRPRWARREAVDALLTACPPALLALPPRERWRGLGETFGLPASWNEATAEGTLEQGALHAERGSVLFGIGIATHPRLRGRAVARQLLRVALDDARARGVDYFLGYSRLPDRHRWPELPLDAYVAMGRSREGRLVPYDHGFRIHWAMGARPVRTPTGRVAYLGIPGAMHDDPQSNDAGVLVITPTTPRVPFPFERTCTRRIDTEDGASARAA